MKASDYMKVELDSLARVPSFENLASRMTEKIAGDFIAKEARFVDHCIRKNFPTWLTRIAESDGKLASYVQRFIAVIARIRGIRVERIPNRGIKFGKGFRPGHSVQTLESITTRVVRKKKVIGETTFNLGIVIT